MISHEIIRWSHSLLHCLHRSKSRFCLPMAEAEWPLCLHGNCLFTFSCLLWNRKEFYKLFKMSWVECWLDDFDFFVHETTVLAEENEMIFSTNEDELNWFFPINTTTWPTKRRRLTRGIYFMAFARCILLLLACARRNLLKSFWE